MTEQERALGAPAARTARLSPTPWRYIDPRKEPHSPNRRRRPPEVVDANNNRVAQIDANQWRHGNGSLTASAPALADALRELWEHIENGDLIRCTARDDEPRFALRSMNLVMALKRAQEALRAAGLLDEPKVSAAEPPLKAADPALPSDSKG